MLLSSLLVSFALAAAPKDVVGADHPRQTLRTKSGDVETTCMTFDRFAVVVSDIADTKGSDGTEVRDRGAGMKDEDLCAVGFNGPKRTLQAAGALARGYFLAVKGPLVLLRGDDRFGAHDGLSLFRASDGVMVLDTSRFVAEPLVLKRQGDIVSLRYLQGLNVGCELRTTGHAHEACVAKVRADNGIAGDVKLNLDITKACKRVAKGERLQLGVPALIADGNVPIVRVLSGKVFCATEP